jgi:RNA-directed DNA polymerase
MYGGPQLLRNQTEALDGRRDDAMSVDYSRAEGSTAEWILEGDIKSCFDNISHDWLLGHIPMDKAILRKWLKAGLIQSRTLWPTEAGNPQGGII